MFNQLTRALLTLDTRNQSTAVHSIALYPIRGTVEIDWKSDLPWAYEYRCRRRDMLRAAIAYAFCQPFSYGEWANWVKSAHAFTIAGDGWAAQFS